MITTRINGLMRACADSEKMRLGVLWPQFPTHVRCTDNKFKPNRYWKVGGQDIYSVEFPASQIDYLVYRGVVTDASEEPVKARLTLVTSPQDEPVGVYNTNERTGRYIMVVQPGKHYLLTAEAAGFETRTMELTTDGVAAGTHEIPLDVTLTRNENTAGTTKQPGPIAKP